MVNPNQAAFYDLDNYRPEDSVGYLMRLILSSMAHGVDAQLADSDLTNAQWLPMLKLHQGHASTVAELARACNLDAGAMTRLLDRLEAKGLCKRVRSETDRRVVHIELTPAGTKAASAIPHILSGVQNAHLAGFNATEFQTLRDYLRRIFNNAQSIAKLAHDTPTNRADPHDAS